MAEISITIKSANMDSETITIERAATITDLKLKIEQKTNVMSSAQRLVYKGKVLKDEQTVEFYGNFSYSRIFTI